MPQIRRDVSSLSKGSGGNDVFSVPLAEFDPKSTTQYELRAIENSLKAKSLKSRKALPSAKRKSTAQIPPPEVINMGFSTDPARMMRLATAKTKVFLASFVTLVILWLVQQRSKRKLEEPSPKYVPDVEVSHPKRKKRVNISPTASATVSNEATRKEKRSGKKGGNKQPRV